MELHELAGRVHSRDSFLEFVAALQADLQADADDWENPSLDRYLEALRACTASVDERLGESPSWRTFATMLYVAKIYE